MFIQQHCFETLMFGKPLIQFFFFRTIIILIILFSPKTSKVNDIFPNKY